MRIRDLKFGTVKAWPPAWRALPGRRFVLGEEGILAEARVRSRDSITIRILHDDEEHYGLFAWDGPPASQVLADLLNGATGRSIREVGDLTLPDSG